MLYIINDVYISCSGINLAVNLEAEEGVYTPRAEIASQLTSKYQVYIFTLNLYINSVLS